MNVSSKDIEVHSYYKWLLVQMPPSQLAIGMAPWASQREGKYQGGNVLSQSEISFRLESGWVLSHCKSF